MKGQAVEQVTEFKYLGTIIDNKLTFKANTVYICKKARQRLYLLRQLKSFHASQHTLTMVYRSLTESVLSFNIISWYGNLSAKCKKMMTMVIKQGSKITGREQLSLEELYSRSATKKAAQVYSDPTHPLRPSFQMLRSGRRLRTLFSRKVENGRSFFPSAVIMLKKDIF